MELSVLDDEDILARPFRNEAVDVEEQALVVAVLGRLQVREDRVRIGPGHLGPRHGHVDVMAGEGGSLDAYALLDRLGPEVSAPGPRRDGDVHRRADRGHAHFLRAVERDRADVAGVVLVGAHDLLLRFDERFPAVGDLHHVDVGRVEQALGVVGEPEDRRPIDGLVGAHALEYREAVVQRMGEHVGGR